MAEESFQEKTEQPTPKKLSEARKKGEVGKSKEISSIAILSAGLIFLFFTGKKMSQDLTLLIKRTFQKIPEFRQYDSNILDLLLQTVDNFLWIVLPIMITLFIVGILANVLQTGLIWSVDPLAPKPSKLNPIEGFKKMFSLRSLVELSKSLLKLAIVGWAAFSTLRDEFSNLIPLVYQDNIQILAKLGETSFKIVLKCCWVIAIIAILDFVYQKWQFKEKMKMTKQEIKDEFKQTEGDPMVKSRIKSIQREMARRRMMEEVPKADVIITNPTHLSVAICYDSGDMAAPRVVAKGAEKVAFRIRAIAKEHNIPIVENKPLAQNLYKLDLNQEIPSQFYQAVAEILAYVYKLKGENRSREV